MSASIVLTVVCDDRPGIVESLSQALGAHDGNWAESSMMCLAGKFAGILSAELPESQAEPFLATLKELESQGMQVVAQRSESEEQSGPVQEYALDLVGQDHPGIIHDITRVLARRGINVQELETTVQSASMSGESLFIAHAQILIPANVPLDTLQDEMEELANELMVDINIES